MQLKLFLLFRTTTLVDEKNLNKPKQPQFHFSKHTGFSDRHDSSTVTVSMIPGASKDSNNHLPFKLVYFKTIACQRCVAKKDFAFMACQLNYVFFIPFQSIPSSLWLLPSSCNETSMLFLCRLLHAVPECIFASSLARVTLNSEKYHEIPLQ